MDRAIKINCYGVIQESSMRDSNLRKFTEKNLSKAQKVSRGRDKS